MRTTQPHRLTTIILSLTAAAALHISALAAEAPNELASNPLVLKMFWQLLQQSSYGRSNIEQAAFIVRDDDGGLSCILWPSTEQPNSSQWIGSFPARTVAIAHTHPNRLPVPSVIDMHTAAAERLPVYVVTNVRIYMTSGGGPLQVRSGTWRPTSLPDRQPTCYLPADEQTLLAEARARRR